MNSKTIANYGLIYIILSLIVIAFPHYAFSQDIFKEPDSLSKDNPEKFEHIFSGKLSDIDHTLTYLDNGRALLFGGVDKQNNILSDTWIIAVGY